MNKTKKILLAAFSLFLIININQVMAADFSEEPQEMLDAKSSLNFKLDVLAERYPAFISFISTIKSNIGEISYTKIMKQEGMEEMSSHLCTLSTVEAKERVINSVILNFDEKITSIQLGVFSFKKSLGIMPDEIAACASSSVELKMYVYELAKQKLAAMLLKTKEHDAEEL